MKITISTDNGIEVTELDASWARHFHRTGEDRQSLLASAIERAREIEDRLDAGEEMNDILEDLERREAVAGEQDPMTRRYEDSRDGAVELLYHTSDLSLDEVQNAQVIQDPGVPGCWMVIPATGHYAGRKFLVYVGDHDLAPDFEIDDEDPNEDTNDVES